MSIKRDIFCFDFRSNFLVSISFLINMGKEMFLPGFRTVAYSFDAPNGLLETLKTTRFTLGFRTFDHT